MLEHLLPLDQGFHPLLLYQVLQLVQRDPELSTDTQYLYYIYIFSLIITLNILFKGRCAYLYTHNKKCNQTVNQIKALCLHITSAFFFLQLINLPEILQFLSLLVNHHFLAFQEHPKNTIGPSINLTNLNEFKKLFNP